MVDLDKVIQKITTSGVFEKKRVLKKLLIYLNEEGKRNNKITEYTIALNHYNRENFVSNEDTIVRVNIYKLRKLLEEYYSDEGFFDVHKISIPKGSYNLRFEKNKECSEEHDVKEVKKKNSKLIIVTLLLGWFLTILSVAGYSFFKKKKIDHPFWSGFNNGLTTDVILFVPKFFLVTQKSSNYELVVRDYSINTEFDNEENFNEVFPDSTFKKEPLGFSFFNPSIVYPLPKLLKSLSENTVFEYDISNHMEYNKTDSNKDNIILYGSTKNLVWANDFLKNTSIKIEANTNRVILKDSIFFKYYNPPQKAYYDYAVVVKKKRNNRCKALITSRYNSGIIGAIDLINEKDFVEKIEEKYETFPEEFEMIVKVSGYNYSNEIKEVVYFNNL